MAYVRKLIIECIHRKSIVGDFCLEGKEAGAATLEAD